MSATSTHPGFPNILSDNVHGDYVLVTCGSTVGKLFFNKLKNCTGKLGSVSCILKADNSWCSPSELESLGGKAKSKNWKRSICLDGKPLLHCFVHLGLSDPGRPAEPPLQSQPPSLPDKQLINPVLAFVKAFRLKGDNTSLKSAIATRFDTGVLSSAIKALWDFSGPVLSRLGLTYQSRRNADKQQLFESVFADLVSAFETLDADDLLPDIYCEAIDLLSLPALELDPVSKRLETNTKVLQSLCTSVESLPPKLVKPVQDQASPQLKSLNDLVESVQKLKDQLSCAMDVSLKELKDSTSKFTVSAQKLNDQLFSTIASSVKELKSSTSEHAVAALRPVKMNSHVNSIDRRNNVIIFGLEERSLMDTRKDVESILEFLCGRSVPFNDAFRLGRFKGRDSDHPPRPLLVKLSNAWDKRLILAAKRNLKDFSIKRLFIREDLSPETRKLRAQRRKENSNSQRSQRSRSSSESLSESRPGDVNQQ